MDNMNQKVSSFNGEPHSYTRFNLTQNMEGDNSQVEMKLSSDMDEEVGGNGTAEHLNHNSNRKPYVAQKLGRTPKNLCFMAAATLLIFIIGYLIGYLVHRKKDIAQPTCTNSVIAPAPPFVDERGSAPVLDWDDVKKLLNEKLSTSNFETVFSEFSSSNHQAGSPGDEDLANKVHRKFKEYGMKTWTDEHFVKVQVLQGTNKVTFKGQMMETQGFLSYSASGPVAGGVLYAYFGREGDFSDLRNKNINMSGRVVLVKAGMISFAEKVANAAKVNASAVLIYADPDDYSIGETTALYGHVSVDKPLLDSLQYGVVAFIVCKFNILKILGDYHIIHHTALALCYIHYTNIISKWMQLQGPEAPSRWGSLSRLGSEDDVITVEVNNVLVERKINNVFGVIKGYVDADRYVVIGAQRDAWGAGFAKSTVGTSILMELARSISQMVENDGFKPRRSIVFASWSGGEYGSIGATEWLEGYLSSLSMKAFSYIDLDGAVTGRRAFKVSASPLMYTLIDGALNEVTAPNTAATLFAQYGKNNWESFLLENMKQESAAYPFLAFSGIPSLSFRFSNGNLDYQYFGTNLDTREKLNIATSNEVPQLAQTAAQFAGQIALRLVHDYILRLDVQKYDKIIRTKVAQINRKVADVQRLQPQLWPKALTMQWLMSAYGSYSRASRNLESDKKNSDLEDVEMCRIINDRIMMVERNLLSPYVSPYESPFRHIFLGSGSHTVAALLDHLDALKTQNPEADANQFRNQFALATWTLQGCANSLAGNIWSLDNEI
uniref:Transferrin receptor protein 1 n=1 Tax=Sphaeramia orbicularis TaxID=375764 RepID=A0A672YQR2_9TELE